MYVCMCVCVCVCVCMYVLIVYAHDTYYTLSCIYITWGELPNMLDVSITVIPTLIRWPSAMSIIPITNWASLPTIIYLYRHQISWSPCLLRGWSCTCLLRSRQNSRTQHRWLSEMESFTFTEKVICRMLKLLFRKCPNRKVVYMPDIVCACVCVCVCVCVHVYIVYSVWSAEHISVMLLCIVCTTPPPPAFSVLMALLRPLSTPFLWSRARSLLWCVSLQTTCQTSWETRILWWTS